jgi:protein-disulfide isomerase
MPENNFDKKPTGENPPGQRDSLPETSGQAPDWAIPISIIVAGALIAGAVFWTRGDGIAREKNENIAPNENQELSLKVTDEDHVRGDRNAPVKVIEYSDFECPFCKMFHFTMKRIVEDYDGQVAWIYRHFPIEQIHPVKARTEAIASECVAELAGNDAFWKFTDEFFELSPSNNQTDLAILPQIAEGLGISRADFNECLNSGRYDELIDRQFNEAIRTGGTGTPWSLVIAPDGRVFSINGAQDYAVVKQIIDAALGE